MRRLCFVAFALLGCECGQPVPSSDAGLSDSATEVDAGSDAGGEDAGIDSGVADAGADGGWDGGCPDAGLELCGNGVDDDCDGRADEAVVGDACAMDTFVCGTCPGASDDNPGTRTAPLKTINRGLAYARALKRDGVYVANASANVAGVYAEDVTFHEGLGLYGRYTPGPWQPDGPRTIIRNVSDAGVKFPPGLSSATVFSGFEVRAIDGADAGETISAITIESSSPTLRDLTVIGSEHGAERSYALVIRGPDAGPTLEGTASTPFVVKGGWARREISAVRVERARITAKHLQLIGGQAPREMLPWYGFGLVLMHAAGTTVTDSSISGGHAEQCYGVYATGDVSNVVLTRNDLVGIEPTDAGRRWIGFGALLESCPPTTAPPVISDSRVSSGDSRHEVACCATLTYGIAAAAGCAAVVRNNQIRGGQSGSAFGVACTSWPHTHRDAGSPASCVIRDNDIRSGPGVWVTGVHCTDGSCREIVGNSVVGDVVHADEIRSHATVLEVVSDSPFVAQNLIGMDRAGNTTPCNVGRAQSWGVAASFANSSSRVENNVFVSPSGPVPCDGATGVIASAAVHDGGHTSLELHSNTVIASAGRAQSIALVMKGGSYRNNIFIADRADGGSALIRNQADSFTVEDRGDPAVFEHNVLWNRGGGPLYRDQSGDVFDIGTVNNGLSNAPNAIVRNNLSLLPLFTAGYHLAPGSPLADAGTPTGAPATDIDGDPRPNPRGTNPDIGADEIP